VRGAASKGRRRPGTAMIAIAEGDRSRR
jgi:hypothetical protein